MLRRDAAGDLTASRPRGDTASSMESRRPACRGSQLVLLRRATTAKDGVGCPFTVRTSSVSPDALPSRAIVQLTAVTRTIAHGIARSRRACTA